MSQQTDSSKGRTRIVIVGGGLAGLSAAEALARRGRERFEITLLEAKRITGGRAGSFSDPSTGQTIDYCQHVAMGCCTNLLGLLDRCGLGDSMRRYDRLQFYHPQSPPSRLVASKYLPAPFHLAGAIGQMQFLNSRQRRQIRGALFRLMRTPTASLRSQTAADWLRQNRQDEDTIRLFWDVVVTSALGERAEVVSMSAARKVWMDGFAAARGASDVLVPERPLSELFGKTLSDRIRQLGVRIQTGAAATRLSCQNGGLVEVEASGQRYVGDHVILAVPWHGAHRLMPDRRPVLRTGTRGRSDFGEIADGDSIDLSPLQDYPGSPITGIHLWLDRQITDQPHAVMVGTAAQWLFRQPHAGDDSTSGYYYQVVISASADQRRLPKEELVATVWRELRHAFPKAKKAELLHSRVVTDPNSVFSLTPQFDSLRPPARTPLPWLHLAGDWIATGWPATMEGAVIAGRMAAASVLESEQEVPIPIDQPQRRNWLAKLLIKN